METTSTDSALVIHSLEQLRAFSDPVRQRIFERLIEDPATAKQVAGEFGVKSTNLYHHFGVLEKAGLIRQVRTRQVRGTTEKYYQATAPRVVIDPAVLGGAAESIHVLAASLFQSALNDMAGAADDVLLQRLRIRTTPEKREALERELQEWLDACQDANTEDGTETFGITLAAYPLAQPEGTNT